MTVRAIAVTEGQKNVTFQITGWWNSPREVLQQSEWQRIVEVGELTHPAAHLRLDAVYHAIADGLEIQLAWNTDGEKIPMIQLSGKGRLDFSEVTGIHSMSKTPIDGISFRLLGEPKNPSPIILVVLDMSKHHGEH